MIGYGKVVRRCQIMFNMRHKIEDTSLVVEKRCINTHYHPMVRCEVRLIGGSWIDFKSIKAALLEVLPNIADVDENGVYDFGVADSEEIVKKIGIEMVLKMKREMEIMLQETTKYGVTQKFNWRDEND